METTRRMRRALFFLLLVVVLVVPSLFGVGIAAVTPIEASSTSVSSITETHPPPPRPKRGLEQQRPKLTLEAAREHWTRWQASAVEPLQYTYGYHEVSSTTDAAPSMIVQVEGDTVISVRPYYYSYSESLELDPTQYKTVDDFFEWIATAQLEAEYHPDWGYPTTINLPPSNENDSVAATTVIIDPMTMYTALQQDLDRQRAVWDKATKLYPNYDYTAIVSCYCMPSYTSPKRITVRNNRVVTVTDLGLNATVDIETGAYRTIAQVLDNIQAGIDGQYYTMDVVYSPDDQGGYPVTYGYDVDPGMADEEQYVTIRDLMVLDEEGELRKPDIPTDVLTTAGSTDTSGGGASDTTTMVKANEDTKKDDEEEADVLEHEEAAPASTAVLAPFTLVVSLVVVGRGLGIVW